MARKTRFVIPGVPQHVIQRGNNREPCFFSKEDYLRYLAELNNTAKKNQAEIHAYVLMTNHVHLLVTPGHAHSISHMMQDLGRSYVRYINHTYKRTGTLWEGRYKAGLIDSEAYLLTCMRYIELNPVRASMVSHPGEYRWSSYGYNANGKPDAIIQPHPIYLVLDKTLEKQQYAYRELFRNSLDLDVIHDIRDTLNQELVLGREDFKDKIKQMSKRQTRSGKSGRPCIEEARAIYYLI